MMLLMIDNYDSFTYNLVQYLGELGERVTTVRNDAIDLAGIETLAPSRIVISPGPGSPDQAGISLTVIERFAGRVPILGVCLGHQAIGQAFGGSIVRAREVVHGKAHAITHRNLGVFRGLPSPLSVVRYHSLAIARERLPACLGISAETADGEIMGVRHHELDIEGVQFHPESIDTEYGMRMLGNFLRR